MNYFIIAGEASGDLHGAALMRALKVYDKEARFKFFGGVQMQAEGGELLRHYREMAFMGFFEVVANLGTISKNLRDCKQAISREKPDVVILIDYPGFNFKIAEYAHKSGIRVFWYIAPKLWAWKAWRVKKLRKFTDKVYSILPFEPDFFRNHGLEVEYVGNPLVDEVKNRLEQIQKEGASITENPLKHYEVALLPGSRIQEVRLILPEMLATVQSIKNIKVVISGAPSVPEHEYRRYTTEIPVIFGRTYELLLQSSVAIVASGTATLETALLQVPQLVVYRMKSNRLATRLFQFFFLKVRFVSLPNLILGREAVKEFIMHNMKAVNMRPVLDELLYNEDVRSAMKRDYLEIAERIGECGAADRAAKNMIEALQTGITV